MSTTKQRAKEIRTELKHLRADWKMWNTCRGLAGILPCFGVDFMLVCPHGGCTDRTCEGFAATAMRADRCTEIAAKAAVLKEELATCSA